MRFLFIVIIGLACGTNGISQKTYFEIPHTEYTRFIDKGKMGMRNPEGEVLAAKYDFVSPTTSLNEFFVVTEGGISLLNVVTKQAVLPLAKKSIKEYVEPETGVRWMIVDESTTYVEDEGNNPAWKQVSQVSYGKYSSGIDKFTSNLYLSYYDCLEYTEQRDENGDFIFYDGGNPEAELYGGVYVGVYSVKNNSWFLNPVFNKINQLRDGYVAVESYLDSLSLSETPKKFFNYYNSENKQLVKHVDSDRFTLQDTLAFLPKGAELFKSIDSWNVYYQLNGKMGVYQFNDSEIKEVVEPAYDYVIYSGVLRRFLAINAGVFSEIITKDEYEFLPLPILPKKSIRYYTLPETGDSYVVIDDKNVFELRDEYISGKGKWVQPDTYFKSNEPDFELELLESNSVLQAINSREYAPLFDEYGEYMYDEETGEELYEMYGTIKAGVFSLNKKEWKGSLYSKIQKVDKGFLVYRLMKQPGYYSSFLSGFCNQNMEQVIDLEYDNLQCKDDLLIASKNDSTGSIDYKGNIILPFSSDNVGVDYKDGFYFYPKRAVLSEWDEPIYDEETKDWLYIEMILKDCFGKDIAIEYTGEQLYSNGVLEISISENNDYYDPRTGFYDLKAGKVIESPVYEVMYTESDLETIWLKKNDKWTYYKIGSPLKKLSKYSYDNVVIIRGGANPCFRVTNNEVDEIVDGKGKVISPPYCKIGNIAGSKNSNNILISLTQKSKNGIYDLDAQKFILKPIYDSIIWSSGLVVVANKGKYGAIHLDSLLQSGSWIIGPNFPYQIAVINDLIYYKKGTYTGVVNFQGKEIVPPKYADVDPIKSNVLLYEDEYYEDEYYDYEEIDYTRFKVGNSKEGEFLCGLFEVGKGLVIPLNYMYLTSVGVDNTFFVMNKAEEKGYDQGYKWGLWNCRSNKEVVPPKYQYLKVASKKNGTFWFKENGLYGMLDSLGNRVVEPAFDRIGKKPDYSPRNLLTVYKNGKKGIFNLANNKYVLLTEYDEIEWFWNYSFFIVQQEGKYGLVDAETFQFKSPIEDIIIEHKSGYFVLQRGGEYSLISGKGNVIVAKVEEIRVMDNYFLVKREGKIELLSLDSLTVKWSSDYDNIYEGGSNYVTVKNDKMGFLNYDLEEVVEPVYDYVEELGALMLVGNKRPWAYLDQSLLIGAVNNKGELVISMEYDDAQSSYYNGTIFTKGKRRFQLTEENKLEEIIEE